MSVRKSFLVALLVGAVGVSSVMAVAPSASAHSGGTDANGCHAGSQPYHCHNGGGGGSSSGGGSASVAPIDDQDCSDFRFQEDAQAHFNANRSDPDRLDADNDGIACEENPHRPSAAPRVVGCGIPDPSAAANSVARLYLAYFNRPPDGAGGYFWWSRHMSGTCLTDISEYFAQSAEFIGTYGSLGNPDFVRLVYLNVMGREPDPAGYTYWAQQLTFGGVRRGTMMVGFSESPEFRSRTGVA